MCQRGFDLLRRGEVGSREAALACFDEALRRKPIYAGAHFGRGEVLMKQGKFEDALAAFDEATDVYTGFAMAARRQGPVLGCARAPTTRPTRCISKRVTPNPGCGWIRPQA